MRRLAASLALSLAAPALAQPAPTEHNVLLFVADGLRPGMINDRTAPAMAALMRRGVRFANTHSLFPTFTMPNASAMATGHALGDTGVYSNTLSVDFEVPGAGKSLTPFLESDPVLGDVDEHFGGDILNQEAVMRAAREAGLSTATIGKLGPALLFDHQERSGRQTIVVDDSTGYPAGIPLGDEVRERLRAAGIAAQAPSRGANGAAGTFEKPGTAVANTEQQTWFVRVATEAVLPLLKERGRPFMVVFWSRDPDGTQHNQGDSLGRLVPGINGPTSLAAMRNADQDLAALLAALKAQGLDATTDVIVTSDHGFSTISKESGTNWAATQTYADVPRGLLPPGFVALDLAHGLGMALLDPDSGYAAVREGQHPSRGDGLIGGDRQHPRVVVAANGGSDLVYVPDGDQALARQVVALLAAQDYASGLFVSDDFGPIPGTLPLSAVGLKGTAVTPLPAIVVNFRSFATGCADPTTCAVEVADTVLQQGQGMHGNFSRADTLSTGAAAGPDFKQGFVDPAPSSNADWGKTMAHILGLQIPDTGKLVGRVLTEAMVGPGMGETPAWRYRFLLGAPDEADRRTVVQTQLVGDVLYFDVAGYLGHTLGLDAAVLSRYPRR